MRGNLDSNNLLNNIEDTSRRRSLGFRGFRQRFFSRESENGIRTPRFSGELYAYFVLVFVIFIVLGLNFIPISETFGSGNESVIFSTYYTSKYNLCLTYNGPNNTAGTGSDIYNTEKECIDGDVDVTVFYKDVNLEGYYRVYAVFSFQLDYQGDWYVPWKKKHFFSSKNKNKRLVIGLSNLIHQDDVELSFGANDVNTTVLTTIADLNSGENGTLNPSSEKNKNADGATGTGEAAAASNSNANDGKALIDTMINSNKVEEPEDDEIAMIKKELKQLLRNEFADEVDSKANEDDSIVISAGYGANQKPFEKLATDAKDGKDAAIELPAITLYLNSFVPNFINVKNVSNKLFKGLIRANSNYHIYKEGNSLLNSIRLNSWNEFSGLFNVYNYNLQLTLTANPLEFYFANQARAGDSGYNRDVRERIRRRSKSFRKLDEFYLLNLRKFVQNEYQHISNFDTSVLNIFNVFSTMNPYRSLFRRKSASTKFNDYTVEHERPPGDDSEDRIDQEALSRHFSPYDNSSTASRGGAGEAVDIDGEMWCNDMNIDLSFRGTEKNFLSISRSINVFSMLFLAKSVGEIGLIWRQFGVVETAGQGRTVSLISLSLLSFQDVLDLFLLLYHSNLFMNIAFVFVLMLVTKFVIVCILHQNFIVLVWRASHSQHIRRGWAQTQKSFLLFYKYYFTFMGILVIILYFFYEVFPFIITLSFWSWFPQIMLDVWRGQNNSLSLMFIFFSIVLKLFFPIYLFFTPTNPFNSDKFSSDYLGHNRNIVYFITFIISVQLILISVQRLKGPRYFASWSILPKIYSYVRPWSKMMQDDEQECVICMYDIIQSNRDWSLTPCDHLFHTKCLMEWTSIKLECPNCRRPIPPITQ